MSKVHRTAFSYFSRWRDLSTRSDRREFWIGVAWGQILILVPFFTIWATLETDLVSNNQWAIVFVYLAILVVNGWLFIALAVRRCRDVGWEPWFAILLVVPLLGIGVFFALGLTRGTKVPATGNRQI